MLRILTRYPGQEVRDAVIDSGMEGGLQIALDYLEDLIRQPT